VQPLPPNSVTAQLRRARMRTLYGFIAGRTHSWRTMHAIF
jgi:hypothetical protein